MKEIIERPDGTRRVCITFDPERFVLRNKIVHGRKVQYKYYPERSRVKPEFYRESRMSTIIAKYRKTGILGDPARRAAVFGDFSSGADFAEAMRKVTQAQQNFEALPADVRAKFENDPEKLYAFITDPVNKEEAVKLGFKAVEDVTKPDAAASGKPAPAESGTGKPAVEPAAPAKG